MNSFPIIRLRRNKYSSFIRDLVQENHIHLHDLVYPIFIVDGIKQHQAIEAMPDQYRVSIDMIMPIIDECLKLGICAIALFPVIDPSLKNLPASESYNDNGLIPKAIRHIKSYNVNIGIFTDIALDPYTTHGHDGILINNYVDNDTTNQVLIKQALTHAIAGADFICPSDMMDGRIGAIRLALENNNFYNTGIMSYAVKYASNLYGPFRQAVGSQIQNHNINTQTPILNKSSYQMNIANSNEAIHETKLDIEEGADIIMVKPALSYLDIVYQIKQQFKKPTAVYHVSGEYAMLKLAAKYNYCDYEKTLLEQMLCYKRAGADIIWTYAAKDVAKLITI